MKGNVRKRDKFVKKALKKKSVQKDWKEKDVK